MEFKFNINDVFKQPVVEINQSLIPPGFGGDRRALWDIVNKVTEVVNAMGEASATAQGLTKPITTAERLRNSEHKLYLLIDQNASNGKGAVTGMLKTGSKGLYVFDRDGQHYQVSPPCVLDFYIHESRQRTGLGKKLFEHMLEKEQIVPVQMAIDRPSDKFLGFLNKHYALNSPVKQMNNYVVFDGFFPKQPEDSHNVESSKSGTPVRKNSANGLQSYASPIGRYGAHRPACSMGQIIHNQTSTINKRQEPAGVQSMPVTNYQGVQYSPPQPNPYVSQSVPNIQYGERQLNENYCSNQRYVPQEGRLQGQSDINDLQTSLQNQMRIHSQQNIPQNSNQTSNFMPARSYANVPQSVTAEGGYSYSPAQNYPNAASLNLNTVTGQQMLHTNPPQVQETANGQQMGQNTNVQSMTPHHVQAQINAMNVQQAYRTSEQQNVNAALQSQQVVEKPSLIEYQAYQNQIHGNHPIPNTSMNVLPTQSVHQQLPNIPQSQSVHQQPQVTSVSNVPAQMANQMANPMVYETAPQASQPPQALESNVIPNPSQIPSMQQQPVPNNQPRMLDGSTPISQNYQYQQPSRVIDTPSKAPLNQQQEAQHYYPNQNQQASPVIDIMLNQLPQQQPIQTTVQQNPSEPASNPSHQTQYQQPPDYYMSSGNALNQPPPQQVLSYNQPQANASMAAVNPDQNPYQQQLTPATNTAVGSATVSGSIANFPVDSQPMPNQLYQTRHPPLPLGHHQHQSAMDLQRRGVDGQNLMQSGGIVPNATATGVVDQNRWGHDVRGVGQFGDSAQQNPVTADAQRVSQSYSVPNVYGSYQNSPQFVQRDASAQRPGDNIGASRNVKEVTEEGVLKYGYPVQMTNNVQNDVDPNPVKLERPRSLTIQLNEEPAEENVQIIEETRAVEDEIDVGQINLEGGKVEEIIEAAPGEVPPGFEDDPSSARKTPSHLTDQGYFDLKFYHNKLW